MNTNCKILFLAYLLFFITGIVYSQEYATRLYTTKDGLVQGQVYCVTQGPKGFLWTGTLGGISRFDGKEFKNFTEEDGLSSNSVYQMQWWNDTLYIVTKEGVDMIVDGKVINVFYDKNINFMMGHIKVMDKYKYAIGHNNEYTFYLDINTRTIHKFPEKVQLKGNLNVSMSDTSFLCIKDNTLYEMLYGDTMIYKLKHFDTITGYVWVYDSIIVVASGKYNNKSGNFSRCYFTMKKKDTVCYAVSKYELPENVAMLPDENAQRIFFAKSAKKCLSTSLGYVLIEDNGRFVKSSKDYNYINSFFEDNEKIIWVATEKGLVKFFPDKFRYYNPEQGYVDNVWSVAAVNDSLILMASYNKGIHIYDNGHEKKVNNKIGHINACYFGSCYGFCDDVLVSVYPGVARYSVSDNTLSLIDDNLENNNLTLFKDEDNERVLVADLRTLVAIYKDYSTEKLFNLTSIGNYQYMLSLTVRNNKIFIGLSRGLIAFNPKSREWHYVLNDKTRFNSLVTDAKNNVWAATNRGLLHITDDSVYFVRKIKMPTDLSSVIIDNNNRLFASGTSLLYVLDLNRYYNNDKNSLRTYGNFDGYFGENPQQDAFFKDKKGNLWLPTGYTVIKILPEDFKNKEKQLHTKIIDFIASGNDTSFAVLIKNKPIKLDYLFNNTRFDFLSVNLKNPELTKYQYILKGAGRQWGASISNRDIEFNNLPPGNYRFSVKASVTGDFESAPETSINFTILPPYWQTAWFIILVIILFTAIIVFITLLIKRKEQKKNKIKLELSKLKNIALSTQIDHHFLANCTSKIVILYESGKIEEANRYTRTFSDFLRRNLMYLRADKISLKEELMLVEQYVELERRYGKDFDFNVETGNEFNPDKIMIFPFMIQPIVENAIKHGVKKLKSGEGKIRITVQETGSFVRIVIHDNGSGLNNNKTTSGNGTSLKIVKERLALFGKGSGISVNSSEAGTDVILTILNS